MGKGLEGKLEEKKLCGRRTHNCECLNCTRLFKMIVGVLTTCHAQYTSDRSICIFLFNRTTL